MSCGSWFSLYVCAALALLLNLVASPLRAHAAAPRIVSLAPSLTEIAYAIGCGPHLIADTSYDDFPAAARKLPHVADLIHLDLERLALLRPSRALALHDQEREAAPLQAQLGIAVAYLPNRSLTDLFADIAGVGEACGRQAAARALVVTLREKIAAVSARSQRMTQRPRVLFLLDLPGFTVGKHSFLDDLIRLAGGVNVAASIDQPYPSVSAEWLLSVQPDVIIVSQATPFGRDVRAREPWRSLRAVQTSRVYQAPSDDYLQRNGPRIIVGLQWLTAVIHRR